MNQLTGFDSADIYMALWKSDWATDEAVARTKIEKVLLPQYKLAKVKLVDEPIHDLPPHPTPLDPPTPENIHWWYHRIASQLTSITMTFDLVDQQYDMVIRFRLDGSLEANLNLQSLDLTTNELIFPMSPRAGASGELASDQFAVGTQEGMKLYCGLGREFKELIPIADPTWYQIGMHPGYSGPHRGPWGPETLLDMYLKKYNKVQTFGNFRHTFNTRGRSRFTDKHYHHSVAADPTEQ
jgi:hypothetical protein